MGLSDKCSLLRKADYSLGDPMIIALLNAPTAETILAALRADVHDLFYPPLQEPLRRALEKRSR